MPKSEMNVREKESREGLQLTRLYRVVLISSCE